MKITANGEIILSKAVLGGLIRAVIEKKVPFRIRATGCSMFPIIRDGDIIIISPLLKRKPRCGDVLAFINSPSESVTVHRIVRKIGETYIARGDNMLRSMEIVHEENILGRVNSLERNSRKVRFGLGCEKVIIGFLNKTKVFAFSVRLIRRVFRMRQGKIKT